MKRWIHSSDTSCNSEWVKDYDKELQKTWYILETDKGRADITEFDDDTGWGYTAVISDGSNPRSYKTFTYYKGDAANVLEEAKQWAESILCSTKVTASIRDELRRINKAKAELAKYDQEKIEYVRRCQDDIMDAISKYYTDEGFDEASENVGSNISEIKRDWMLGAIEDDLMTEEEFEDILDLIDIIDLEYAAANS